MSEYKHGAYGNVNTAGNREAAQGRNGFVYVGTAPVHTTAGGAARVNAPVTCANMAEAKRLLGYSDDWAAYTLCEAMHAHFESGVGPLVFINVLDPVAHKATAGGTATITPANGRAVILSADKAIIDSVEVDGKELGADYTLQYDGARGAMILTEAKPGALGVAALDITWDEVDPSKVTNADVIGATDGAGLNTGLYAIKNVYQESGLFPSFLLAPGFSSVKAVHDVMALESLNINGHWDAYMLCDLPIQDQATAVTLDTAEMWKRTNGYKNENETVYFPMAKGQDGHIYHISVLAAANLQKLLIAQDGFPYKTASNTECPVIENLYLGEGALGRVYDDTLINDKLNRYGIASAAFVGGRWAIWGSSSADWEHGSEGGVGLFETNRMMLYHISNEFQHRRARNVDKPMTMNDIKMICAEEQARLDSLVKTGALTYATVRVNADEIAKSDMVQGDYSFTFEVTVTPLAKSLTAVVSWTDKGYTTAYIG